MGGLPDWMTWYKKPTYVDYKVYAEAMKEKDDGSVGTSSNRDSTETGRSKKNNDVPKRLSLERIMKNKTCSPMSLYDFYMYLKYIELSAENLEFYVWFKNYEQGRLTAFPDAPRALTPVSSMSGSDEYTKDEEVGRPEGMPVPMSGVEMDDSELYARIASFVQPGSGCGGKGACEPRLLSSAQGQGGSLSPMYKRPFSVVHALQREAAEADVNAHDAEDVAYPELVRPQVEMHTVKHAELETIKQLFFVAGAPKELNLPAAMRKKVIESIEQGSTDAENLQPAAEHAYMLLKSCSHRNFVRLGVGNGTFETLCVATSLGIVLTIMGIVAMMLLAFVSPGLREASRWRGIGIWPMWFVGVSLILSGLRGSCFFLMLFSVRQRLPWEKFDEDRPQIGKKQRPMIIRFLSKLMIFDRKMKVKDDDLRRLQNKVLTQSLLGGAAFATIFVIIFLCIPMWKPL